MCRRLVAHTRGAKKINLPRETSHKRASEQDETSKTSDQIASWPLRDTSINNGGDAMQRDESLRPRARSQVQTIDARRRRRERAELLQLRDSTSSFDCVAKKQQLEDDRLVESAGVVSPSNTRVRKIVLDSRRRHWSSCGRACRVASLRTFANHQFECTLRIKSKADDTRSTVESTSSCLAIVIVASYSDDILMSTDRRLQSTIVAS